MRLSILKQYHDWMMAFINKNVAAGVFVKEDGQKLFEASENQGIRLELLKTFLEKQSVCSIWQTQQQLHQRKKIIQEFLALIW